MLRAPVEHYRHIGYTLCSGRIVVKDYREPVRGVLIHLEGRASLSIGRFGGLGERLCSGISFPFVYDNHANMSDMPRQTRELATGDAQVDDTVPRMSDQLADRLFALILEQGLQAGDRLPSERELGEQFGRSRTVVREAIRNLAGRGVVNTRRGASPTVAAFPASALTESITLYLRDHSRNISYEKVHEVRVAFETEIAAHAARRASHVGIARLRDQHELIGQLIVAGEDISAADVEFHRQLARIADNSLFLVVLDSIIDLLFEVRRTTLELPEAPDRAQIAHGTILEAVASGSPEAARLAMRHHLDVVLELWARSPAAMADADRASSAEGGEVSGDP